MLKISRKQLKINKKQSLENGRHFIQQISFHRMLQMTNWAKILPFLTMGVKAIKVLNRNEIMWSYRYNAVTLLLPLK